MQLNTIKLENGQEMLVEVVDVNLPKELTPQTTNQPRAKDLPKNARPVGAFKDSIKASMSLLENNLKSVSQTVSNSFKENQPDEFTVEVNFGFAGEGAIPFIASAQSNAGIKIKATWKKSN